VAVASDEARREEETMVAFENTVVVASRKGGSAYHTNHPFLQICVKVLNGQLASPDLKGIICPEGKEIAATQLEREIF